MKAYIIRRKPSNAVVVPRVNASKSTKLAAAEIDVLGEKISHKPVGGTMGSRW